MTNQKRYCTPTKAMAARAMDQRGIIFISSLMVNVSGSRNGSLLFMVDERVAQGLLPGLNISLSLRCVLTTSPAGDEGSQQRGEEEEEEQLELRAQVAEVAVFDEVFDAVPNGGREQDKNADRDHECDGAMAAFLAFLFMLRD